MNTNERWTLSTLGVVMMFCSGLLLSTEALIPAWPLALSFVAGLACFTWAMVETIYSISRN